MVSKAKIRVGRRGALLLILGLVFVLIGVNFQLNANDPSLNTGYAFAVHRAPLTVWAGVFIADGLIAIITSFRALGKDVWGFSALASLTAVWAAMSLFTYLNYDLDRALITMLIWGGISAVIVIASGMRGPNDD